MSIEPSKIIIGDTINWVREYGTVNYIDKDGDTIECPSSSWTLTYNFANPDNSFLITAVATGSDFEALAESTTTQKWIAGTYDWAAYVTHSTGAITKRYEVDRGVVDLVANMAVAVAGYDGRSHVKKVLDGLEAIIEGRAEKATMDWISYSIAGRARSIDPRELRSWYAQYKWLYKKELAENKISKGEDAPGILIEFS